MTASRHSPAIAFAVGVLGIALFSGMDAVMKGLVLAIGTFATMFWRNLVGIGLSGLLYLRRRSAWPPASTMRIHIARGVLSTCARSLRAAHTAARADTRDGYWPPVRAP